MTRWERGIQRIITARYSSSIISARLRPVNTIASTIDKVDIDRFRREAFTPALPFLLDGPTASDSNDGIPSGIPAVTRWFSNTGGRSEIEESHFVKYKDVLLPYELVTAASGCGSEYGSMVSFRKLLHEHPQTHLSGLDEVESEPNMDLRFDRFAAPLDLFLQACRSSDTGRDTMSRIKGLYVAQAQLSDLPAELRADLPTPKLVLEAGKGDVYDANIWLGLPPTYTPLHKDPNPNLFVQLASQKAVRLFDPSTGSAMMHQLRSRLGSRSSIAFRGEEMMQGPERELLEDMVWNSLTHSGYEAVLSPGNGLFIPKGWWHSIKSVGSGVTGSVNWWFR